MSIQVIITPHVAVNLPLIHPDPLTSLCPPKFQEGGSLAYIHECILWEDASHATPTSS